MSTARYEPGPVVWGGILATTCLLLLVFKQILWLVVPALFALIAYYLVLPIKQRLVLSGFSHDAAAIIISVAMLLAVGAGMVFSLPWLVKNLVTTGNPQASASLVVSPPGFPMKRSLIRMS